MFISNQRGYIFTHKHGKSLKLKWNVPWATIWWASGFHQRARMVKCLSIREGWVATECWHSITETHCFGLDPFAKTPCYYILKGILNNLLQIPPQWYMSLVTTESQTVLVLRLFWRRGVWGLGCSRWGAAVAAVFAISSRALVLFLLGLGNLFVFILIDLDLNLTFKIKSTSDFFPSLY